MKKLFPILIVISLLASGCTNIKRVGSRVTDPFSAKSVDSFADDMVYETKTAVVDVLTPANGFILAFIAIELNSNISSLVIDKTKEKMVGYNSQVMSKLTPGNYFLVLPPRVSNGESFEYDDDLGRMIRNYMAVGKYGIPVSNVSEAEYVVVINIRESLNKHYGVNYSDISFSINDKLDIPVYAASVRVESKSDKNFWYYETKKARPVRQLTVKGLTQILAQGLPAAHGEAKDPGYFAFLKKDAEKKEEK